MNTLKRLSEEQARAILKKSDEPNVFERLDQENESFSDKFKRSAEYLNASQSIPDSPYNAENVAVGLSGGITKATLRNLANEIAAAKNLKINHAVDNVNVNPSHAQKIAEAYEVMKHDPTNPEVKKAYDALIKETMEQYEKLKSIGLKMEPIKSGIENPYKAGSKDLIKDVTQNDRLYYYPTEQGFGSTSQITDNPLLQKTGEKIGGQDVLANDAFRIVHDAFGHVKEGATFGPLGEEKAWRQHMQMFSPDAQKALTSETRGQNSWVNFGPKGEFNRANPTQTIYADQKTGILPEFAQQTDPKKFEELLKLLGKK